MYRVTSLDMSFQRVMKGGTEVLLIFEATLFWCQNKIIVICYMCLHYFLHNPFLAVCR